MLKHEDTIVVGDLHGQHELAKKIISVTRNSYNVVFVGDYLDSWTRSSADQFATISTVVGAARFEPTRIFALMGNHERSYLHDEFCSGWKSETAVEVQYYQEVFLETLLEHLWLADDILITHAGVTNQNMRYNPHLTVRQAVEDYLLQDARFMVGRARGGSNEAGGIFWCDFTQEFEPVEGIRQIFGHTRGPGIRSIDENYCIDCLEDSGSAVALVRADGTIDTIEIDSLV